ncbi:MAG: hypothetical protein NVSMB9_11850 [Isosphaeraceae bacterium]
MPFQTDTRLTTDAGGVFGEYVTTFVSNQGQVRADLFRRGRVVEAHVSFPTGCDAGSVTDPYVSALWNYAHEHGFPDDFRLVLS